MGINPLVERKEEIPNKSILEILESFPLKTFLSFASNVVEKN